MEICLGGDLDGAEGNTAARLKMVIERSAEKPASSTFSVAPGFDIIRMLHI